MAEPASDPAVFAVGAADNLGVLCGFSSRGPSLALSAPGCRLDTADPASLAPASGASGTSHASALTAAALAAVRAYDPALTWPAAEQLFRSTARNGELDVAMAFSAAGLQSVVDAGVAAMPAAAVNATAPIAVSSVSARPSPPASKGKPPKQMSSPPRPHLKRVTYARRLLTVVVDGRPPVATLRVMIQLWAHGRFVTVRKIEREADTIRAHVTRLSRIQLAYVDPDGTTSPTVAAKVGGAR